MDNWLASRSPYVDLWSDVKSMHHTLERVLASDQTPHSLAPLDSDRLRALAGLLRDTLTEADPGDTPYADAIAAPESPGSGYALGFDLRERLRDLPEIAAYRKKSKMGFEAKVRHLLGAVEKAVDAPRGHLFEETLPRAEFEVLSAVLAEILGHAQSAARE
jgi:hypothetical protein